ncbi:hypothetical protein NG829_08340 [Xanthomonas sacchari]|uniref:Uncharacterized protein n=1 Tax=Xanthomonas sacchari TaxID=56458 RepID=A0ABT3DTX0_9XANT|nr:hypothetical protein [Xanthomonas sacchari]MCW0398744.1 hypothetical protein [Xanthomonas sacchari]MCW0418392.1 hypothetical protein [Xanthomonas sacchari]UYK72547.1 hypothetical protein NG828_20560 [Xanthomonas sacchari]UYK82284.1 hypothetical protein NG829_08340 [Xanthomonas sacchari]
MTTKQRIKKQRIYATRINGEVVAYTRHHSSRAAQKEVLDSKVMTEEASIDDLIRIGKEGIEVGGLAPETDPSQQPLAI